MITHDNRLVLVDFGIARRRGLGGDVNYATYAYAAPELLAGTEKGAEYLRKRFGELPSDSNGWGIDERTDLYSVGVILYELFTGTLPQKGTEKDIYRYSTKELGDIICKCMSVEPKYRYRNAKELSSALEKVQNHWNTAPHRLQMRRAAMFVCWLALAGSMGSTASAAYIRQVENAAQVSLSPGHVTVSPHQSITLTAENIYPDGIARYVDLSQMDWSYSEDNIAQIDGGRLMGLQKGTVTVTGKHRSTTAVVEVEVTESVENGVEVSLQYVEGASISRYAGGSGRDMEDGRIENSLFVSPQSLDTDEQTLWLTDSGSIRTIQNGIVSTINGLPSYLRAKLVRHSNSVLYFLSEDWEEDDGTYRYGIAAYHGAEDIDMLYETESGFTVIHDMAVSSDGKIWLIQENFVEDMTRLYTLDASQRVTFIADLPAGATNLCFDENDVLYISVPGEGMIYRLEKSGNELVPFLGGKDERNFIDGTIPNFYRPTSMICVDQFLYVLDFDTVRRITILEGSTFTETVVGIPVADTNPQVLLGDGSQAVLVADNTATLSSGEDGSVLLSDPKNSTIYRISVVNPMV